MAIKIRPLVQILGRIIKLPVGEYLDPTTLGSGTADGTKVLDGSGTWVSKTAVSGSSSYYDATGGDYNVTSSDEIVEWKSGTNVARLPTAVGIAGKRYTIKNTGTGVITVDPSGSQTVFGDATFDVYQDETIDIVSNGANWV